MAQKLLESSALSTFCGNMATMLSAGIQIDEATLMLAENRGQSQLQDVCHQLYRYISAGDSLAIAMDKAQVFPQYAIDMVATGERSGRVEQVLQNLEAYYEEESRLFAKLRSSASYPAVLLVIMTIILAFTVAVILPVFSSVYSSMTGSMSSGPVSSVGISTVIGWVALAIMVVAAIIALLLATGAGSPSGRMRILNLMDKVPQTKRAMYQLSLSRFTAALATLMSSGVTDEEAMSRAMMTVKHPLLRQRLERAADSMADLENPRSLTQAISEFGVFEPLYARMLNVGMRSGNVDETLSQLSSTFFDNTVMQIDRALDNIEPMLAAFLTIAVGATLIAIMLPLIGAMGSIG